MMNLIMGASIVIGIVVVIVSIVQQGNSNNQD